MRFQKQKRGAYLVSPSHIMYVEKPRIRLTLSEETNSKKILLKPRI